MIKLTQSQSLEEIERQGDKLFRNEIRQKLTSADDGRFVAIDIASANYAIDDDDHAAVQSLLSRHPEAIVWLTRAGESTTYRMRSAR